MLFLVTTATTYRGLIFRNLEDLAYSLVLFSSSFDFVIMDVWGLVFSVALASGMWEG